MLKVTDIVDDERCFAEIRKLRWPNGVHCAHCGSNNIVKDGHDETQPARQRYECKNCQRRFDDLTNTIFAGHHQSLKIWIIALYLMGLNISNRQIAKELNLCESDTQAMTDALRKGVVDRQAGGMIGEEDDLEEIQVKREQLEEERGQLEIQEMKLKEEEEEFIQAQQKSRELIEKLHDVRRSAVKALEAIAQRGTPLTEKDIEELISCLNPQIDDEVKRSAAAALGEVAKGGTPLPEDALKGLIAVLAEPQADSDAKGFATMALEAISKGGNTSS